MKNRIKTIGWLLSLIVLIPILGGCDNDDSVISIFSGKTWRLARLTTSGSSSPFYSDLWESDEDYQTSVSYLSQSSYFYVLFNCTENGDVVTGTVNARGVGGSINNATLTIDKDSRAMSISGSISGEESDQLGKAFLNGLLNVYKYEGDINSLTLYFKDTDEDGNTVTRLIGLSH